MPERKAASLGLLDEGETYLQDPVAYVKVNKARRNIMTLAREIGLKQTKHPVDTGWAMECVRAIALEALGVVDWNLGDETSLPALEAIYQQAKHQLIHERGTKEQSDDDIPF